MGYSRSIETVRKRRDILAPLFRGVAQRSDEIVISTDHPVRLAGQIRECFAIARRKRHELPELYAISELFTIHAGERTVTAKKKTELVSIPNLSYPEVLTGALPPLRLPFASTAGQIIQFWIDAQPSIMPIEVKDCALDPAERGILIRWASMIEPPWTIVDRGEGIYLHIEDVSL